jgi:polyphosphate kinase 2
MAGIGRFDAVDGQGAQRVGHRPLGRHGPGEDGGLAGERGVFDAGVGGGAGHVVVLAVAALLGGGRLPGKARAAAAAAVRYGSSPARLDRFVTYLTSTPPRGLVRCGCARLQQARSQVAGAHSMSDDTPTRTVSDAQRDFARLREDFLDSWDEELELETDDDRLGAGTGVEGGSTLPRRFYFRELFRLQGELVKLQDWVAHTGQKLVVIFEGRDAAGKGGVIKRITQRLNPRICRVAALPAPNSRERTQWYFQRYVSHLPAGGEIVLFDRSWYNRAGVERVMGFCTEEEYEAFFEMVPEFEKMLSRSGIKIVKYWFSITDEEQEARFLARIEDPLKQWKLSPMDLESRVRWEAYTHVKEVLLERTHIPEAPWWVVPAVDKKRARLNCIRHLLSQLPYAEVEHPKVVLPSRVHHPDYARHPVPPEMIVPELY